MMPMLNAMATTGLVALPGMMTGQIIAGADPVGAAKYQMLIMFLIAGATALGSFLAAVGGVVLLTDERHRLRLGQVPNRKRKRPRLRRGRFALNRCAPQRADHSVWAGLAPEA